MRSVVLGCVPQYANKNCIRYEVTYIFDLKDTDILDLMDKNRLFNVYNACTFCSRVRTQQYALRQFLLVAVPVLDALSRHTRTTNPLFFCQQDMRHTAAFPIGTDRAWRTSVRVPPAFAE